MQRHRYSSRALSRDSCSPLRTVSYLWSRGDASDVRPLQTFAGPPLRLKRQRSGPPLVKAFEWGRGGVVLQAKLPRVVVEKDVVAERLLQEEMEILLPEGKTMSDRTPFTHFYTRGRGSTMSFCADFHITSFHQASRANVQRSLPLSQIPQ